MNRQNQSPNSMCFVSDMLIPKPEASMSWLDLMKLGDQQR
jgi:hypothetical protein